jgi:DNA-binding MarR family transcriptional regulator
VTQQPPGGAAAPETPNGATDLAWAVHHLAVAVTEVDVATAHSMKLGASDYLALKYLTATSEPCGPVELGRILGMTSGAATGLIDRLERAGHVRRTPHPSDRRRQVIHVTAQAQQQLIHSLLPLATGLDRTAAALTGDQQRLVADTLTHIAALHRRHARAVAEVRPASVPGS